MGYDLHITRAENWSDSAIIPIPVEEWRAYLENDTELRAAPDRISGEDGVCMEYGEDLLYWHDGEITVKNPAPATIRKITRIAATLEARVVGDDSEEYRPNGDVATLVEIGKPPGLLQCLLALLRRRPLPERPTAWTVTQRWTDD